MHRYEVFAKQKEPVLRTLRRGLPLLPERAFRLALNKKDVLINQQRTGENIQVNPGDSIVLYTHEKLMDIPVVYEDEKYLVVNKPAGINTDPNHFSAFSLLSWTQERVGEQNQPALCHRLDNQTSGLVCIAKSEEWALPVKQAFKERSVLKRYECLVAGMPIPSHQVARAFLIKDAKAAKVKVFSQNKKGGKQILTEYEVITPGEVSRLSVVLHSGRTHQIRAHLAFLGYPLIGDDLYGSWEANHLHGKHGLKLCAVELGFPDQSDLMGLSGKNFRINAPF